MTYIWLATYVFVVFNFFDHPKHTLLTYSTCEREARVVFSEQTDVKRVVSTQHTIVLKILQNLRQVLFYEYGRIYVKYYFPTLQNLR